MIIARAAALGCCLVGMWLPTRTALASAGEEFFAQGVGAFKRGSFAAALDYFQQALAQGLDRPALRYNLGASRYKLGRYAEAETAFRACARDPAWASLATYNMGLAAYQRGERVLAADYFERAWRTTDSDELRALAFTMLERTDVAASRRARGMVALNLGYNSNVTFAADNQALQTTREPDWFAELQASAAGQWSAASNAPRWNASLYSLNYAHLREDNITELALAAAQPAVFKEWRTALAGEWQYVLRDGHGFQQIASVRVEGARAWPDRRNVRVGLQLSAVEALDDNFEFLKGSRQVLDVSASQPAVDGIVHGGVKLERNQRQDLATANEFFSYSPTRYGLWFRGSWPLGARWRLEPAARYAQSRYADADRRANGLVATREDRELEFALRASYRLTMAWRLTAEYTQFHNRSNFDEFSYSQNVIMLGVTRPL